MVNIYSTNRGLEKEVEKGVEMLTVDIEKTPFYKIGLERGQLKERFENAILMMENFNHSMDEIVKVFNIKKEELIEYIKEKKEKEV